jgi:hypothetical protein
LEFGLVYSPAHHLSPPHPNPKNQFPTPKQIPIQNQKQQTNSKKDQRPNNKLPILASSVRGSRSMRSIVGWSFNQYRDMVFHNFHGIYLKLVLFSYFLKFFLQAVSYFIVE